MIPFYDGHSEDPDTLLAFENHVAGITPAAIQQTACAVFGTPHRAVFVLRAAEEEFDE